jgi:hypothetical protein
MGKQFVSNSGACAPWTAGIRYFSPGLTYNTLDDPYSHIMLPDQSLADAVSYCRQPTKGDWTQDFGMPMCYSTLTSSYVECNIPRCGKFLTFF